MKKIMLFLIILSGGISLCLAIAQYLENNLKERENILEQKHLQGKIDSLKIQNDALADKVDGLVKDNIKLSTQLTDASLKLYDNIVGSGELEMELESKGYDFIINWRNNSDLPVNNAVIVIEYLNRLNECKILKETETHIFLDEKCLKNGRLHYQNVSINAHAIGGDSRTLFPFTKEKMNFRITVNTKKSLIVQNVVFQVVAEKILCSQQIFDSVDGVKILKSVKNELQLPEKYWKDNFNDKEFNWLVPGD